VTQRAFGTIGIGDGPATLRTGIAFAAQQTRKPRDAQRGARRKAPMTAHALSVGDEERRRLSALDSAFLYFERPNQLMYVGCVAELDGPVAFGALVDVVEERLCRPLPRYRQRPVRATLDLDRPSWEDDPAFDVRRHVRRVALPAPGGAAELHELVDALFAVPLDARHPLWEMHLVEGLHDGSTVLLCKMHHCMVDGISGTQILEVLTDASAAARGPAAAGGAPGVAARPRAEPPSLLASLAGMLSPSALLERAREAGEALGTIASLVREPSDLLPFNRPLGDRRRVVWTTLALDDVLAIRGRSGCKVNDVVLAIIAGALERYLAAHDVETKALRVRAIVPVSVRRADDHLKLGNLVTAMLPRLPLGEADPVVRLRRISEEMQALKERGQARAAGLLLAVLDRLPAPVEALFGRLAPESLVANTVCTNVPGPREQRSLLGRSMRAVHAMVPLFQSMGLEFAILSYAGTLSISAVADPDLVPDVEQIAAALDASAADLLAAHPAATADEGRERAEPGAPPTVGDVMTREVVTIRTADSLLHAYRLMRGRRIRHLPVVDGAGDLVGIVTERDLLSAAASSLERASVEARIHVLAGSEAIEVMETHLCVATPDENACEAGARMMRHKIGCLPVVGDGGRLVGIVTEQDFVRWATEHMTTGAGDGDGRSPLPRAPLARSASA
jgi:WS/DGAT/MGAT family acyltransferase